MESEACLTTSTQETTWEKMIQNESSLWSFWDEMHEFFTWHSKGLDRRRTINTEAVVKAMNRHQNKRTQENKKCKETPKTMDEDNE